MSLSGILQLLSVAVVITIICGIVCAISIAVWSIIAVIEKIKDTWDL